MGKSGFVMNKLFGNLRAVSEISRFSKTLSEKTDTTESRTVDPTFGCQLPDIECGPVPMVKKKSQKMYLPGHACKN